VSDDRPPPGTTRHIVDSMMLDVPMEVAPVPSDDLAQVVIAPGPLSAFLRRMATKMLAAQSGPDLLKSLTGADWTVTGNPEEVAGWPLPHDCPTCQDNRNDTVRWLLANPGRYVALARIEYDETYL
jgi:hypothetical protein